MSALETLWSRRRERPVFVAVTGVTLLALAVYPFVDWWLRSAGMVATFEYWDFGAFGGAVERWQAGEPLYPTNDEGGYHGGYLYPPIALVLFLPFDGFWQDPAARAWNLLSLGLLWLGLQAVVSGLGYDLRHWERGGLLWLVVGFQPLLFSMKLAQMAPLLSALLCFSLATLLRDEDRWSGPVAGGLTAAVGVVKLAYAPTAAHLLSDRRRFLSAIATGAVLAVASLLAFGVETNLTYLDVLAWGVQRGSGARPPTLWLPAYYRPLQWLPGAQWLRIAGSLAVAGYALTTDVDDELVFALGLAAFPLLTPLAYTYYFVALLPAVLVLLRTELRRTGRPWIPVLGLLLLHLHAYGLKLAVDLLPQLIPPVQLLAPYWVLQPGLWGNLLLFGLAMARVAEGVSVPTAITDVRPK